VCPLTDMADCLEDTSSDYDLSEAARQRAVADERARARDFRAGAAAGGADGAALQRGFDAGLRLASRAANASAAAQALLRCALALAAQRRLVPQRDAEAAARVLLAALDEGARPLFRALRASGGETNAGADAGAETSAVDTGAAVASAADAVRELLLRLHAQLAEARGLLGALFGGAGPPAALPAREGAEPNLALLCALIEEGSAAISELLAVTR
jgi:hypothetical protein